MADSGNIDIVKILINKKIESRLKGLIYSKEIANDTKGQWLLFNAVDEVLSNLKGSFRLRKE
jgi:hypothetical protein